MPRMPSIQHGTVAIEFALIVRVLLMWLVSVVEVGYGVYQAMQVRDAAKAGGLYVAKHGWNSAAITAAVVNATGESGMTASPAPSQFCGCSPLQDSPQFVARHHAAAERRRAATSWSGQRLRMQRSCPTRASRRRPVHEDRSGRERAGGRAGNSIHQDLYGFARIKHAMLLVSARDFNKRLNWQIFSID